MVWCDVHYAVMSMLLFLTEFVWYLFSTKFCGMVQWNARTSDGMFIHGIILMYEAKNHIFYKIMYYTSSVLLLNVIHK